MEHLSDLVVYTQVVEKRSFTSAGKILHMSTSAVSKHIARLEAQLSLKLLQRSTHHLMPTEAGAVFYDHCVSILAALETARADAAGLTGEMKGVLRIHSTAGVGLDLVAPATIEFMKAHSSIHIDLSIGELPIDLTNRRLDLVIASRHFGREDPKVYSTMGSRNLGRMPYVVCASPAYLLHHGVPDTPEDLSKHNCLVHVTQKRKPNEWLFEAKPRAVTVRVRETYRSNIERAILNAAVEGLGIARLPEHIAREHLEAGKLRALFPGRVISERAVKAFYPRSKYVPRKVRLFVDLLAKRYDSKSPDKKANGR